MTYMKISDVPDIGLYILGQELEAVEVDGKMMSFETALDSDDQNVTVDSAVVWNSGWNRNGVTIHPDHLEPYAESSPDLPILFGHDQMEVLGVGARLAVLEDGSMTQSMVLDTPEVRRFAELGIRPQFSIHLQRTADTQLLCSICGKDYFGGDCPHYIGEEVEGEKMIAQWTNVVHAETSMTWTPAVPGTGGVLQFDAGESLTMLNASKEAMMADKIEVDAAAEVATEMEVQVQDLTTKLAEVTALLVTRDEEIVNLTTNLNESMLEEANRVVTDYRERKGLAGDHDKHVARYQKDPAGWKEMYDDVSDSSLTTRTVGLVQGIDAPVDTSTPQAMAAYIQGLGLSPEEATAKWAELVNEQTKGIKGNVAQPRSTVIDGEEN